MSGSEPEMISYSTLVWMGVFTFILLGAHVLIRQRLHNRRPAGPKLGYEAKELKVLHALENFGSRVTPNELACRTPLDAREISAILKNLKNEGYTEGGHEAQHQNPLDRTWAITGKGSARLRDSKEELLKLGLSPLNIT